MRRWCSRSSCLAPERGRASGRTPPHEAFECVARSGSVRGALHPQATWRDSRMRRVINLCLALAFAALPSAHAQVPVQANPNHDQMLASADPLLAANKRLIYDFWREVFEAAQMDRAE